MITLHRKTVALTAWHLTDQNQMLAALSHLTDQGWRGSITYNPVIQAWRIELNADNPTRQVIADTGDWLIVDVGLRKLTAAECAENYEVEGS